MIRWVETIGSTNDGLRALAEQGASHGAALAARRQTAGRGRLGRSWDGGAGNLTVSVLLRASLRVDRLPLLTLGGGVVLAELLRARGADVALKWPNDLLDADERKIAGLLAEAEWAAGAPRWVIVGLGVNVLSAPPGAASLADLGCDVDREALAEAWVTGMAALDADEVVARWMRCNRTIGREVVIGDVRGEAVGLDPDGALRVRATDGERRVITGDLGFL